MNNKDLYATIATGIYHNDYWDNMEFREKEKIHPNPEGKKRRSNCKSILLGLMYGRGANSIAEQINSTKEEAQSIIDGFYKSFPKVKQWMDKSKETCKANGYVSDLWGRRRRLPDMQLSKFEVKYKDENKQITFNPLLINSPNIIQIGNNDATLKDIENKLYAAKGYKQIKEIKEFADKQGIKVKDNGGFISEAERQCVNARIQGGAATLTKLAMIATHYDKTLNELGFRMLIPVHDEIIGECPIENAEAVAKRLPELMIEVAKKDVKCPMKCDATIEPCWYYTDYGDALREEYQDMLDSEISKEKAMELLNENHCECLPDQIKAFISS